MKEEKTLDEDIKEDEKKKKLGARKKQILDRLHTEENIKTIKSSKKPLKKLWVLIIILVLIGLIGGYNPGDILPGYKPSWAYISFEIEQFGMTQTIEEDYYQGWTKNDLKEPLNHWWFTLPAVAFGKALFKKDFTETPSAAFYGLISILILGCSILLFEFYDKKKDFSVKTFSSVQCLLYSLMLIPSIYTLSVLLKFVGSYLLIGHHYYKLPQTIRIGDMEITKFNSFVYPVPYLIIIVIFILLTIIFTVIEIDMKTILKERETSETKIKTTLKPDLWR